MATRVIPIIGLLILLGETAHAAYKISQGAHIGGEGFEDVPEGATTVEGEGEWLTPDITEEELEEFAGKDIPPEIIEALRGDLVLQEFLWDVAKLRLEKQGRPLTAEELRELSGVLQNADPEAVRRLLPYLRSTSGDSNLTEAMERALAISSERLPAPPTAEERRRPAQPTPVPEAEAEVGEGGGGSRSGEAGAGQAPGETGLPRERLKELDAYPNLKEFFNSVLAPTSQRTGTEVTPAFLEFLLANAERLNDPAVLERIRRSISAGEQNMASLQQAIQSLLQGERERRTGEGEGTGRVAAGRATEGRGRARAGEGEGELGGRTRRRRGEGGEGTGTRGQRGGQRGQGAGGGRRRRQGQVGLRTVTGPTRRRRIEPLGEVPTSAIITRGFRLLRGLSKGRAYEAGDVAEITIRVEAVGGRHEITVPIVIDSRSVSGQIISLTAHVKGTDDSGAEIKGWGITGTDVVIPANADVTYEWRPRARRGRRR